MWIKGHICIIEGKCWTHFADLNSGLQGLRKHLQFSG